MSETETPRTATPVSSWKKPREAVELPSGNFMVLRRPGFQTFMRGGLIPNGLMSVAQSAVSKGKQLEDAQLEELMEDPDSITDIMEMVDDVTVFCAVEPEVKPDPGVNGVRDPNTLYVDEIDAEDKMFIFQYATGGSSDVESFREEARNILESLGGREEVGQDTE